MLYVVATPIGNLGDMSPRALEVLNAVSLIAAEDTRRTLQLLNHFGIRKPLTSLHEHNEGQKAGHLVRRMAEEGLTVALVTDAGTPAISDPGALLVREAAAHGVPVLAVPGPAAVTAALSVSGILNPSFTFYGFPPREKKALRAFLQGVRGKAQTAVFHESPFRVAALLEAILDVFLDVPVSLSCDLTKLHELTLRGPASQVLARFRENPKAEKGEYVLAVDLAGVSPPEQEPREAFRLEARLLHLVLEGQSLRDAGRALADSGFPKNAVYAASLRLKGMLTLPNSNEVD